MNENMERYRAQFGWNVSGESFCHGAYGALMGKPQHEHEIVCAAFLVCDPENPYDADAVAVTVDVTESVGIFRRRESTTRRKIGYVPAQYSRRVAHAIALAGGEVPVDAEIRQFTWEDDGRIGYRCRLLNGPMMDMSGCLGITTKEKSCSRTAAKGLLTCTQHSDQAVG